jgi:hypothetical protein
MAAVASAPGERGVLENPEQVADQTRIHSYISHSVSLRDAAETT